MDLKRRQKIRRHDLLAKYLITAGGLLIIVSMVTMIALMVKVALPLFSTPDIQLVASLPNDSIEQKTIAIGVDDYRETAFRILENGDVRFYQIQGNAFLHAKKLREHNVNLKHVYCVGPYWAILWNDGLVQIVDIAMNTIFDESGKRSIEHKLIFIAEFDGLINESEYSFSVWENSIAVIEREKERITVHLKHQAEDLFGDMNWTEEKISIESAMAKNITSATIIDNGSWLLLGTNDGQVEIWSLDLDEFEGELLHTEIISNLRKPLLKMEPLLGGISVVIADSLGQISTWMVRENRLVKTHDLGKGLGAIDSIVPSMRHKGFAINSTDQQIIMQHMTSESTLFRINPASQMKIISMDKRGQSLCGLDAVDQLWIWSVDDPHPDVNNTTLWGKLWYENYEKADYVWQSSSASDDFEPKMSLIPLLFGSLKGTFYALIFALPLALMAAIYVSHLMHPKWKRIIKPTVELMAAIPSIVIGFLAALWLAPMIEDRLVGVFLTLFLIPMFLALWAKFGHRLSKKNWIKFEFVPVLPIVLLAFILAFFIGSLVQDVVFAGDFKLWFFEYSGSVIDQRNSVVISFALGFTVIPVIFTISEDALSNVPNNMVAAAMALGSDRWQTIWRVVLPIASPGIFAAVMIGFGRAVGETMIVLMATGNTPIIDSSIFNGMRTLSANIAVEIPEAPVDGSLYRVLFLSALLLFVLTFVINTLAEIVRNRLQTKYRQG